MKVSRNRVYKTSASVIALTALTGLINTANAQTAQPPEEIIVTGIRQSLASAIAEKRSADNLIEVIKAEDIGKLPDQNLAEVLENITGIQITRTAGVGSGVQIRGTDSNRTEINGVSTVGSGFGRTGISFEDIPASLISSVEVTKVPEAKTIEGSVGGTINLETLRPLDLDERVMAFRAQVEQSDLADTVTPRVSGTIGKKWTNPKGQEMGVVLSGSYAKQDVAFFNPRADRDNVTVANDPAFASSTDFDYLRIQFFQQNYDNFEYETINLNGTFEYSPNDNTRFYVDGIYNDQERAQESYVLDLSGVSNGGVVSGTDYTGFETINFGEIDGPDGPIDLGSVEAALSGTLFPTTSGGLDPNFRVSTSTGARVTKSSVVSAGLDFAKNRLSGTIEASTSNSATESPQFRPRLEFINPNTTQPIPGGSGNADNGVPVVFDLSNDTLQFGFAQGVTSSPSTEDLLNPANYQLGRLTFTNSMADNRESAARLDFNYDMEDALSFITSIDAGYRYNETTSERNSSLSSVNYGNDRNRPSADQFANVIIAGPDNFDAADDRDLFIRDYLAVDPELAFENPQAIVDAFNQAIIANNADPNLIGRQLPLVQTPSETTSAFFNISEKTHALYAQANFDGSASGMPVRGNLGLRWIDTTINSVGNTVTQGNVTQTETSASYDFFLPRFNVVANATDDILLRGGIARDIRRPGFTNLSTSINFGTGSNTVVPLGNPGLVPESVWSYDLSAEYYFSPSSLISVGLFHKSRTNLFTDLQEDPPGNPDPATGVLNIDVTPPCEQGGIFNPIADRNINSPIPGVGICVPFRTQVNGEGTFTQTGIELAAQFDLSSFEDRLGWASGFGFIGNYTYQNPGGSAQDFASNFRRIGGNRNIFGRLGIANPLQQIVQPNLSKNTYNATVFYEKYDLSARARYTWRSSYSLPASVESFKAGAPLINAARGQLNANVTYDINDNISVGVEGVNILQNDQQQYCVKDGTLLCFNGFTDRRLIAGLNVKF
ncbi:MAG: TonB-dependent receptor [Hyphomonadaceae bacterium]|nr:TonB-dependent receptor [Hyphomonadaceae bacterium]